MKGTIKNVRDEKTAREDEVPGEVWKYGRERMEEWV